MTRRPLKTETLAAIGAVLTSMKGVQLPEEIMATWKINQIEVVGVLQVLNGYSKKEAEDAFLKITALVYAELRLFVLEKSKFKDFKDLVADILTKVPKVVMR